MRFVEKTGANWAAVQIRAVEMEIEQQKREWEEKKQAQRQQEELERQRAEKEENEILTYSRDDALNKVTIRSRNKSVVLGKRKFESAAHETSKAQGKKNNGTEFAQNGISKETEKKSENVLKTPPKRTEATIVRNTRNSSFRSTADESLLSKVTKPAPPHISPRGVSRKSDRSTSIISTKSQKSQKRSASESTSRSAADSMSLKTATTTSPDDSDSECSLDVMIDSNDVNDSDSNSVQNTNNAKGRNRFDSTSRDDDTLLNDDSTMTDETAIEKSSKSLKDSEANSKITSSPRTRSRGTVKINLWTLDESPILAPKRQKLSSGKNLSDVQLSDEKQLKADFGVKECKVAVFDIKTKAAALKAPGNSMRKPSQLKSRASTLRPPKNNHTLDSWLNKSAEAPPKASEDATPEERIPVTRLRRNTIFNNQTL